MKQQDLIKFANDENCGMCWHFIKATYSIIDSQAPSFGKFNILSESQSHAKFVLKCAVNMKICDGYIKKLYQLKVAGSFWWLAATKQTFQRKFWAL